MLLFKLCVFTAVLVVAFAVCTKQNRIKLNHKSGDFDFSVNGDGSGSSALLGSDTAYSAKGPVTFKIKGKEGVFRNFDWNKLCFEVKGASVIDVVYEGLITDPKCDSTGCSFVGPALGREAPKPLVEPNKYKRTCLENQQTQSKISISIKAASNGPIMVRKMAMEACIFD